MPPHPAEALRILLRSRPDHGFHVAWVNSQLRLPAQLVKGSVFGGIGVQPSISLPIYIFILCIGQLVSCLQTCGQTPASESPSAADSQLAYVRRIADQLQVHDQVPTASQWPDTRQNLRENLLNAWGGWPESDVPLEPKVLGRVQGDGYQVERIIFQTLPNVWMTANAYVPNVTSATRRLPAVLCVHGHWSGAKQDPVVQSRCIGLAKLGYFVLCVDAFGAGERAIGKRLGEYHGDMTGAMLLPIGKPLSGIQVYENRRAVDYLQSREEVNPERIGITGASGGGNQTMYAGAMDDRLKCVVPTCSVGTYRSYLGAACCMCEVVPGAIQFTEEGNILGLSANRGLMVISATQDAFQFSVGQATISVQRAGEIAAYSGATVAHTIIESPHHYNQPMREAMYGWMNLHLKDLGDGLPVPEPKIETLDPEQLRCFPGETRPDGFVTLPKFAHQEAVKQIQRRRHSVDAELAYNLQHASSTGQQSLLNSKRYMLRKALGPTIDAIPPVPTVSVANHHLETDNPGNLRAISKVQFESELGVPLNVYLDADTQAEGNNPRPVALLLDMERPAEKVLQSPVADQLRQSGWRVAVSELRAVGRLAYPQDKINSAIDHNTAEWSLWIGRPMLGQWVADTMQAVTAVEQVSIGKVPRFGVVGIGNAGNVAITAGALDLRITEVRAIDAVASLVSPTPYRGVRLGLLVPNMFNLVGDIEHIAAMIAPRKLFIQGGLDAAGNRLSQAALESSYTHTRSIYAAIKAEQALEITGP